MPAGCFASFPVTVPRRGSLTRVDRRIPQAGVRRAGQGHSCAKPAAPEPALFSAREAPPGQLERKVGGKAYFRNSCLAGGPKEKS